MNLSSGSPLNAEKLAQKLAGTALVLCDKADILRNTYPDKFGAGDIFTFAGKTVTAFEHNVFHREIQARINEFHNIAARNPVYILMVADYGILWYFEIREF